MYVYHCSTYTVIHKTSLDPHTHHPRTLCLTITSSCREGQTQPCQFASSGPWRSGGILASCVILAVNECPLWIKINSYIGGLFSSLLIGKEAALLYKMK